MQEDRFDSWLREAARSYNEPPDTDLDTLWTDIERKAFTPVIASVGPRATPWWANQWLRAAAVLAIGVGLGRLSSSSAVPTVTNSATPVVAAAGEEPTGLPALNEPDADKYLGQTVALLASLQTDVSSSRNNAQLATRASTLLSTTRFLLDSPSSTDPKIRALLEDLELVLVQIVQMPSKRTPSDVDLIHQAMEQRDVMPRLRTAVANIYSAE